MCQHGFYFVKCDALDVQQNANPTDVSVPAVLNCFFKDKESKCAQQKSNSSQSVLPQDVRVIK